MALAAKQGNCQEMERVPAEDITIHRHHDHPAANVADTAQTPQEYGKRPTKRMTATKQSAQRLYKGMRTQVAQGYERMATKTKDLARRTQHIARQAKKEHPVQLLAIVAGVAFVAGIAMRIWRSRAS